MINTVLAKVFGTKNDRELKAIRPLIGAINDLESNMEALSDEDLMAQTAAFKEKLGQGATLDDILVPAYATVREAGRRFLNMRHFDVQLIRGVALHPGQAAARETGERQRRGGAPPAYSQGTGGKGGPPAHRN